MIPYGGTGDARLTLDLSPSGTAAAGKLPQQIGNDFRDVIIGMAAAAGYLVIGTRTVFGRAVPQRTQFALECRHLTLEVVDGVFATA